MVGLETKVKTVFFFFVSCPGAAGVLVMAVDTQRRSSVTERRTPGEKHKNSHS